MKGLLILGLLFALLSSFCIDDKGCCTKNAPLAQPVKTAPAASTVNPAASAEYVASQ